MTPPAWHFATLPKPGQTPAENEDALGANERALRFVVADGASEGWKSGPWARHLVAKYLKSSPDPAGFAAWFAEVRRSWAASLTAGPTDEPWYAAAKREQGAYSTLLGVELRRREVDWAWKALIVGDSCLLRVADGEVVQSVPLGSPDEFGTAPALLPSEPAQPIPEVEWLAGTAAPGECLILATDTTAASLLRHTELASQIVTPTGDGNQRLIRFLERMPRDRDDDLTLLVVHLPLPTG